MTTYQRGATVEFTRGPLGTLTNIEDHRFADLLVQRGDRGTYHGPHPSIDGWHVATVEVAGNTYYVPVADAHIRPVAAGEKLAGP